MVQVHVQYVFFLTTGLFTSFFDDTDEDIPIMTWYKSFNLQERNGKRHVF